MLPIRSYQRFNNLVLKSRSSTNISPGSFKTAPPKRPFNTPTGSIALISIASIISIVLATAYVAETNETIDAQIKQHLPAIVEPLQIVRVAMKQSGILQVPEKEIKKIDHKKTIDKKIVKEKTVEIVKQETKNVEPVEKVNEVKMKDVEVAKVPIAEVESIKKDIEITTPIESKSTIIPSDPAVQVQETVKTEIPTVTPEILEVPTTSRSTEIVPSTQLPMVNAEKEIKELVSFAMEDAVQDLARQSIILRKELEATLLKDIYSLDENGLRSRIAQLASELFDRITWEGIRLHHSLKNMESIIEEKYKNLLMKQRNELEFEMKQILLDNEKSMIHQNDTKYKEMVDQYERQLKEIIAAQAEGFQKSLRNELENQAKQIENELTSQMNHLVAKIRKEQVDELSQLMPKIISCEQDVTMIQQVLDDTASDIAYGKKMHQISAEVLAIEMALTSSQSSTNIRLHLETLKKLCADDELLTQTLSSLPNSVVTTDTTHSLMELLARFRVLRNEVRKAALVPEQAPMVIGQLIGSVLARVSYSPSGYVSGSGVEEVLARATYQLERGDLKGTLQELNQINEGYPAILTSDWKTLANDRLVVEQALKIIKAHALLRHRSLGCNN